MDPTFHLSRVLRRLHWLFLVIALCGAAGWGLLQVVAPVYRAEARLFLAPLPEAAEPSGQSGAAEHLQLVQQRALTRENLAALSRSLHPQSGDPAAFGRLLSEVSVAPVGQPQTNPRGPVQGMAFAVGSDAPDPAVAAVAANGIAELLIREDRALYRDAADQRLSAAKTEVARLSGLVADGSAALLDFRKAEGDALPDSLAFRRDQVADLQDSLVRLRADRSALADSRARMVRVTTAARMANGLRAAARPARATDLELARTDTQIRQLDSRIDLTEASLATLAQSIAETPANAVALARLEQDLSAQQAQHAEAMAAQTRAETQVRLVRDGRISVVEAAVAPGNAFSPNRPLVMGASLGAGGVLGFALVLLLGLLRPSIDRPSDLTRALGLAPFATLPNLPARAAAGRVRLVVWAGLLLAGAAVAGIALRDHGVGLEQIVDFAIGLRNGPTG